MQEIKLEVSEPILDMLEGWRNERITEYREVIKRLDKYKHRNSIDAYENFIKDLEKIGGYNELFERYLLNQQSKWSAVQRFDKEEDIGKNTERALKLTEKGKDLLLKQLIWRIITDRTESIKFVDSTIVLAEEIYK